MSGLRRLVYVVLVAATVLGLDACLVWRVEGIIADAIPPGTEASCTARTPCRLRGLQTDVCTAVVGPAYLPLSRRAMRRRAGTFTLTSHPRCRRGSSGHVIEVVHERQVRVGR